MAKLYTRDLKTSNLKKADGQLRTNKQIDNIIKIVEEKPGMILYTMINKKLEDIYKEGVWK